MKFFIIIVFFLIFSGLSLKTYQEFDEKVSPPFINRCSEWGGQSSAPKKFNFECVKNNVHHIELEKDYRYTFYGVAGFLFLLGSLIFFSFQGNKNED